MPDAMSNGHRNDDVDQQCWEEAAQLRGKHQGWIIIWLAAHSQFRAYRRLPGTRRDTVLSAATTSDLADQISQAEQAAPTPPCARRNGS
jgi:hypothetical protein